jgi:hypothetical protein
MSNEQVIVDREAPPWAQRLQTDLNGVFTRLTRRTATLQASGFLTPEMYGGSVQAAVDAAGGSSRLVLLGAQTYTLSQALNMRPGVHVLGTGGSTLFRSLTAAGSVVDFATHTAHGAILENVTVDGGGGQGSGVLVDPLFLVHNNGANDIRVIGCTLQHSNGHGFFMYAGGRPYIEDNTITDINLVGLAIQPATQVDTRAMIRGNRISDCGYHPLQLFRSNYNHIIENHVTGNQTLGSVVNTNGTTVTWVSGPNFSALRHTFIIYNGGSEGFIQSINSSTQLTLNASAGVLGGVPASFGTGDMISVAGGSANVISKNILTGGVGGHVVLGDIGSDPANNNHVQGNTSFLAGSSSYSVQPVSSTLTQFNSFIGNRSVDAGKNTTAGSPLFNCGIINAEGIWTHVADNTIIQTGGGSGTYGIVSSGTLANQMILGDNAIVGTAMTAAIHRAVLSITLGAGWGSTAATSLIVQNGKSIKFRLTAGGAGIAANPTFTLNTTASPTGTNGPLPIGVMHRNATGVMYIVRPTGGTYTGYNFDLLGFTPTTGEVHDITVHF